MARKAMEFLLSDDDRAHLRKTARSGRMPYRSVTRASILLAAERYRTNGTDGLEDLPRGGVGRGLSLVG